jgi:hypothetical protein
MSFYKHVMRTELDIHVLIAFILQSFYLSSQNALTVYLQLINGHWPDIQNTYDCKLKKIREMLLTTLEHNQHDVIDVMYEDF